MTFNNRASSFTLPPTVDSHDLGLGATEFAQPTVQCLDTVSQLAPDDGTGLNGHDPPWHHYGYEGVRTEVYPRSRKSGRAELSMLINTLTEYVAQSYGISPIQYPEQFARYETIMPISSSYTQPSPFVTFEPACNYPGGHDAVLTSDFDSGEVVSNCDVRTSGAAGPSNTMYSVGDTMIELGGLHN